MCKKFTLFSQCIQHMHRWQRWSDDSWADHDTRKWWPTAREQPITGECNGHRGGDHPGRGGALGDSAPDVPLAPWSAGEADQKTRVSFLKSPSASSSCIIHKRLRQLAIPIGWEPFTWPLTVLLKGGTYHDTARGVFKIIHIKMLNKITGDLQLLN